MSLTTNNLLKGRYRIESILGQGGMGAVYQATDELLNIPVAVKENLFLSEEYTRQFQQETQILACLRHPNLPRVLDFCSIEGEGQYLVMDYIGGEDLRDLLKRSGPLSERDVVLIGYHISEALQYMHSQIPMVVHRDVKPGNIKLTQNNEIYLVDFGLAKQIDSPAQMTMTGARAMTPGFSPPEQYGTARTDARSDIYSLGATLYNALTGAVPEDALDRVTDQSVLTPILDHRCDTEHRLVKVIEKAMSLKPEDRYQTAKEFQEALLLAARLQSISLDLQKLNEFDLNETPESTGGGSHSSNNLISKGKSKILFPGKRKAKFGWVIVLFLVLSAAGLVSMRQDWVEKTWDNAIGFISKATMTPTFAFTPTKPEATSTEPVITETATATVSQDTSTPTLDNTLTPTVLPSLTATQNEEDPQGEMTVTITPELDSANEAILITKQDQYPIVFASNRQGSIQLWLMNDSGTDRILLTNMTEGACQPDWSPDGSKIVFVSPCKNFQDDFQNSVLYVYSFEDESIVPLLNVADADMKEGNFDPEWSPDGSVVAFVSNRTGVSHINIYDIATHEINELSNSQYDDLNPTWHPDGDSILFVRDNFNSAIWQISLTGNDLVKITQSGSVDNYHPVWDSEGKYVLFSQHGAGQAPWLVKLFTGNFGSSLEDNIFIEDVATSFPVLAPHFTAQNDEIIFESWPDGSNHDIYRVNIDGSGLVRLTTNPGYDFDPDYYQNRIMPDTEGED